MERDSYLFKPLQGKTPQQAQAELRAAYKMINKITTHVQLSAVDYGILKEQWPLIIELVQDRGTHENVRMVFSVAESAKRFGITLTVPQRWRNSLKVCANYSDHHMICGPNPDIVEYVHDGILDPKQRKEDFIAANPQSFER